MQIDISTSMHGMNGTVHEIGPKSTQNSVCNPMGMLPSVNNALFKIWKFQPKNQVKNQIIMWWDLMKCDEGFG